MLVIPTLRAAVLSSSFTPASIPGLAAWYDASRLTGLADGDPVQTWPDLSGNGRDATQATTSKKPTYKTAVQNGRAVLRFDGVDDFLATTAFSSVIAQPNTVIFVGKVTSSSRTLYDGIDGTNRQALTVNASNKFELYAGVFLSTGSLTRDNLWHVQTVEWNTTDTHTQDAIASASGNAGSAGLGGITIGANTSGTSTLPGDVGEFLLFSTALSAAQRQQLLAYLRVKWATP